MAGPERRAPAHETVDTPPRVPIYAMAVTLAVLAVGVVVTSITLATVWRSAPEEPSPFADDPPRLLGAPALSARMDAQLEGIGWVDRNAGIVHMPIEQAMTLAAERGLSRIEMPARGSTEDQAQ